MNKNKEQEISEDLLACFFYKCEEQFRFLEKEMGFRYLSGLVEYRQGRQIIRAWHPGMQTDICHLATRYEKDDFSLEIRFNTEDFLLECAIYFDSINHIHLEELVKAAKKGTLPRALQQPALQPGVLEKIIGELGKFLYKNRGWLIEPDAKLLHRALTIRQKILEHNLREQLKRDMEGACAQAARAFMRKDFVRTISLLGPYEAFLSAADLKKLSYARSQIDS